MSSTSKALHSLRAPSYLPRIVIPTHRVQVLQALHTGIDLVLVRIKDGMFQVWKSHVDDGDEELMPLKAASQEYLPQQKQRSTTDMQKAQRTEHLATKSRASQCTAAQGVCKSRSDFSSIGLLVSSIYSTMMSALWLGLAAKRQDLGEYPYGT